MLIRATIVAVAAPTVGTAQKPNRITAGLLGLLIP